MSFTTEKELLVMNETLKVIKERYSCRAYTNKSVEPEKIKAIAKAGLQAPSALNIQPWHVIAITDKGLIDELNDCAMEWMKNQPDQSMYNRIVERGGKPYYNSPTMFLILKKVDGGRWADLDCGIVTQNIALAATSLGLGNVISGMCSIPFAESIRAEEFKSKVKWPQGYEFGMAVLAGYAQSEKQPHEIDEAKLTII